MDDAITKELLREEEKKMKRLSFIVDITQAVLMQSDLSLQEALEMIQNTKKAVLSIFPDKEDVYDLIYAGRFQRIIAERYPAASGIFGNN